MSLVVENAKVRLFFAEIVFLIENNNNQSNFYLV